MFYRVYQFYQGLTAKTTSEDISFISKYLNPEEQALFFQLRIGEQKHSLNVAYGCQKDAPGNTVLIKAALLHDIGKSGSNLTLINKAFVVIAQKINLPEGIFPIFLKKAIHFKNNHAEIGYRMLLSLKTDPNILFLIRNHHKKNIEHNEVMNILQKYDNKY